MPKGIKIKREVPPAGTELYANYKGKQYKAIVVTEGKESLVKMIRYNGINYNTMSAAAKAITKIETNGWIFWKDKPKHRKYTGRINKQGI